MKLFSSTRYANVTATVALAIAMGGTGYAAGAHGGGAAPVDKTAPITVFSVKANGNLQAAKFMAPMTGKPKVKHASTGTYVITLPGMKYADDKDAAVCTPQNYGPYTAMVSGAGASGFAVIIINASKSDTTEAASDFKCAVWNLDGK